MIWEAFKVLGGALFSSCFKVDDFQLLTLPEGLKQTSNSIWVLLLAVIFSFALF